MRKWALLPVIFLVFIVTSLAAELQVGASVGAYQKSGELFGELAGKIHPAYGLELGLQFKKTLGLSLEASYFTAAGKTSVYEKSFRYSELHLAPGVNLRFPLLRLKPSGALCLYVKGSGLIVLYSEANEGTSSGTVFGFSAGGGISLDLKRIGLALDATQNFASKAIAIEGLDATEDVSFSGTRLALKLFVRLGRAS